MFCDCCHAKLSVTGNACSSDGAVANGRGMISVRRPTDELAYGDSNTPVPGKGRSSKLIFVTNEAIIYVVT